MFTLSRSGAPLRLLTYAATVALALGAPAAWATHVGEDLERDELAVASNNLLLDTLRQWQRAPAKVREARLQHLLQHAAQRRERLIGLMAKNPQVAALRILPAPLRAQFPAEARGMLEDDVSLEGEVYAEVASDVARGLTQQRFFFQPQGNSPRYALQLAEATDRERTLLGWAGRKLRLKGTRLDGQLLLRGKADAEIVALDGSTSGSTGVLSLTPKVTGDQKTLVILANFSDKALTCTASDINSRMFGTSGATMNVDYRQSSRDLVSFSGQTVGPFAIPYTSSGSCDFNAWGTAADNAAKAAGIDLSQYKRISYVTPPNSSCGWSGLAYMPGTRSWVQSCASTGVYVHELGHNLSFHHAGSPTAEYGDSSDPMGGARMVQFNAPNRVMAGWLPTGSVLEVFGGGSYSLSALALTTPGTPQVLRLVKPDTNEFYYVSLRQAIDLDTSLPTTHQNTLSIHRSGSTLPVKTVLLQSLAVGQTFSDSVNGLQISHQGLSGNVSTVGVAFTGSTCQRSAPTVSVSPASQTGAPGTAKAYTVSVTNRNTAACGSASFAMSQVLPAGFGGSFGAASLSIGAGASASTGWTVSSPSTATDASYTLDATASETSVANAATAHASYVVFKDGVGPTVALTSPAGGASFSGNSVTLSASASDASGVQQVEFLVNGSRLATDTSAPYSAKWTIRKLARGSYTLSVRATDKAGNVATSPGVSVTLR
jgi:hypothetical protein